MALGADELFLTNDSQGSIFVEQTYYFGSLLEVSAHGTAGVSVSGQDVFMNGRPLTTYNSALPPFGRIVDFGIGVVQPALSASGFVSGTTDAGVYINGAAVLSTRPSIPMLNVSAGASVSAGATTYVTTNTGTSKTNSITVSGAPVSAIINTASAGFSVGDVISIDYNARSVGSAAAGIAGRGVYGFVTVRYGAR